ncbi:anti-sigma factor domain-containing protein [Clostridium sp. Ade.TY]|uniref:anti-sigma factor domain-containing protein n=1 Tax=Clostridium sp. Ade.TY TaxID=1391647 RepID=UPI00041B4EDA|nr:anti-sigma factor domain-containing protein [Clostridium sp. Ade.TY]
MDIFDKNKYKFSTTPNLVEISNNVNELRKEEILKFEEELFSYNILIKDLFTYVPSENELNLILNIAFFIVEQVELLDYINSHKKIPFNMLSKKVKRHKKKLIEWSDYIIAYTIIFSNPNYKYLQDYLAIEEVKEEDKHKNVVALKERKNNKNKKIVIEKLIIEKKDNGENKDGNKEEVIEVNHKEENNEAEKVNTERGIVLKIFKKSALILTSLGQVCKVYKEDGMSIGEEVSAKSKKRMKDFKPFIVIALIALAIAGGVFTYKYNTVDRTILINTTSKVKIELNCFNNVIEAYSPTDKGEDMINSLKLNHAKFDKTLEGILKYSKENGMLPEKGVLVTVTGEPLEYGTLENTRKYVVENKIDLTINNVGNERNLYNQQAEK